MDLTGQRFGKLVVLGKNEEQSKINRRYYADCQCDCGNIVTVNGSSLLRGTAKSCGCLRGEKSKRFTEVYINEDKGYGVAFVNVKGDKDYFVAFSAEDKDEVQDGAWHSSSDNSSFTGFDRGSGTKSKSIALHRKIAAKYEDLTDKQVDHRNHNIYDVRNTNLKACTPSENSMNRDTSKRDTPHIRFDERTGKYIVRFNNSSSGGDDVQRHFNTEDEADAFRVEYEENSNYSEFIYNRSKDYRYSDWCHEYKLGGENGAMHPFHIVDKDDMPMPDPDDVIQPFTNMPSATQPIFNPFTIVNPLRFTKGKY